MEKINLIKFNNNNVEAITYNGVDLDKLIYNNAYEWSKSSSAGPMYLVGLNTGLFSEEGNSIFDYTVGLNETTTALDDIPYADASSQTYSFGMGGPAMMVCKGTRRNPYEESGISLQIKTSDDSYNPIRYSTIENYGHLIKFIYSKWLGEYGGESGVRLTLTPTESNKWRRIYDIKRVVDENNTWLFEGLMACTVKKHLGYKGDENIKGSVLIDYYPPTFESIMEVPKICIHNYKTSLVTEVDNSNVSDKTSGFITKIQMEKISSTQLKFSYELSENPNSDKYRDCSIVFYDKFNDSVLLQMMIIQEPHLPYRVYWLPNKIPTFQGDTKEALFSEGNVVELNTYESKKLDIDNEKPIWMFIPKTIKFEKDGDPIVTKTEESVKILNLVEGDLYSISRNTSDYSLTFYTL